MRRKVALCHVSHLRVLKAAHSLFCLPFTELTMEPKDLVNPCCTVLGCWLIASNISHVFGDGRKLNEYCGQQHRIRLIEWISDTRSQKYIDLQSLITCLEHGEIVTQYAVLC